MIAIINQLRSNSFLRNFTVYGFGQFFNLVTPLLLVPYIVSVCGEENFGKSSVALAASFFLIVFIDYGSELVGVREVTLNRDQPLQLQKIFAVNFIARFIVLLLVLILALLFIFTLPFLKNESTLFTFSLIVIVGQYFNQSWFLQGVNNMNWIALSNILSKVIYLVSVFILVTDSTHYYWVNFCFGLGTLLSNGFFTILLIKKYNLHLNGVSKQDISEFLKKDFKMFSSQIFNVIQLYSPVILVSTFGNNFMAGQYRIVEQIIVTFKTYIFLFFNFTYPRVCHDMNLNLQKALRNWSILNGANLLFIVVMMAALFLNAKLVVQFFNASHVELLTKLLKIAVFIPILLVVSVALKQLVLARNLQKQYVFISTISVVLSLLLIVLSIPYFQLSGVFYSLLISEVIVIIFYLFCIKNIINDRVARNA